MKLKKMTPKQYRKARLARGTVLEVAALLGTHPMTINKRERGGTPITQEAALALLALPPKPEGDA